MVAEINRHIHVLRTVPTIFGSYIYNKIIFIHVAISSLKNQSLNEYLFKIFLKIEKILAF